MRLEKHVSDLQPISHRSPQGCGLSPPLFSLYTNSCISCHQCVSLLKSTDDTTRICPVSDKDESAYRWESDYLVTWCSKEQLRALKTVEMISDLRKSSIGVLLVCFYIFVVLFNVLLYIVYFFISLSLFIFLAYLYFSIVCCFAPTANPLYVE